MNRIAKLFAFMLALGVTMALTTPVFACDLHKKCPKKCAEKMEKMEKMKVESYAHPTLFSNEEQVYMAPVDSKYVVGAKIMKSKNKIGVKNKENVYVHAFSKDILDMMKAKQFGTDARGLFDPKKPILRSELAFVLAEGLDLKAAPKGKQYHDVASKYWAAEWISKAYDAGLMIGYPDDNFKPDQAITKAEVFAVIAQMIDVPTDKSLRVVYKGKDVKYIPDWAISASKEVAASNLLEQLPDQSKIVGSEYLSKEQVAYLVGALRKDFRFYQRLTKSENAPECIKNYVPASLTIKLEDRISARHSNIGEKFSAKTTKEVVVAGTVFPAGSKVKGEVVAVQRPGLKNPGFVRVKFIEITNDGTKVEFPKVISEAQADKIKNPNFVARLLGMPFTGSARIVGVVGRTVGTGVNVIGNDLEKFGDELSGTFVETLSLQPVSGAKSFGNALATPFIGVYDILKLVASGAFGVIYEITDEIKYLILPSTSNDSSLNPGEELVVIF